MLLASTDVYRPAAREQLRKLAADLGVGYFSTDAEQPTAIAEGALDSVRKGGQRWLILDTAGRLHVDAAMMEEAKALHGLVSPAETLFVVDSMAGQDAINSARAFHEALPLTGVVLTKTDGDARGGVALSVREVTGRPIKLVGTGEKLDALEAFVPARFASRILGMGDVVGLVEQVQRQVDAEELERVAKKVKAGREISLEDFREQLKQLLNMGGFEQLMDKLPGVKPEALAAARFDPRQLRRQIGIIDSMTRRERRQPAIIDGSRKRRIAGGAGLPVQEVSRLLKQHKQLGEDHEAVEQRRRDATSAGRGDEAGVSVTARSALNQRAAACGERRPRAYTRRAKPLQWPARGAVRSGRFRFFTTQIRQGSRLW